MPDLHDRRDPQVTNNDLARRLETLETKTDIIMTRLEQASGAWMFLKIMGAIALGVSAIWTAVHTFFHP